MNKHFTKVLFVLMLLVSSFSFSAQKRYGNKTVGFIDFPAGYYVFQDPNNVGTALQLQKGQGEGNIITLDYIDIPKEQKITVNQGIENFRKYYISVGVPGELITVNHDIKVAKNKASQLIIPFPNGVFFILNLVEYKNKMYYIAVEGNQIQELYDIVNRSWKPNK